VFVNVATVEKVKQLREATGAKLGDCHTALVETGGDVEAAKDILRIKGLGSASNKAGRETGNGVVVAAQNDKRFLLLSLPCETDFVAMNEKFIALAREIAEVFLALPAAMLRGDAGALLEVALPSGEKIGDAIKMMIASTGENVCLGTIDFVEAAPDLVVRCYVHRTYVKNVGKIGAMAALRAGGSLSAEHAELVSALANEIAMQIAAMKPLALRREDLSPEVIERERNVHVARAQASGKPEAIVEKMVAGSMEKFYSSVVLLDKEFFIGDCEGGMTVRQKVAEVAKTVGVPLTLESYALKMVG
jgi:elongation factor Ts